MSASPSSRATHHPITLWYSTMYYRAFRVTQQSRPTMAGMLHSRAQCLRRRPSPSHSRYTRITEVQRLQYRRPSTIACSIQATSSGFREYMTQKKSRLKSALFFCSFLHYSFTQRTGIALARCIGRAVSIPFQVRVLLLRLK